MFLRVTTTVFVLVLAAATSWAQPTVAPNEVRLCEHPGFLGHCESFFLEPSMRQRLVRSLSTALDDKASSIVVGSGVVAHVFESQDFRGLHHVLADSSHSLSHFLNEKGEWQWFFYDDRVSSLIVVRRTTQADREGALSGVSLRSSVEEVKWQGSYPLPGGFVRFFPLPQEQSHGDARFPQLAAYMNDKARFARLHGDVEVELFPSVKYHGKRLVIPGDSGWTEFNLSKYGVAESVSSLIVRQRGQAAPAPKLVQPMIPAPPPPAPTRGGTSSGDPYRAPPAGGMQAVVPGEIIVPSVSVEADTNRPGHDYRSVEIPPSADTMGGPGTGVEMCRDACAHDPRCKAFTYVKPGIQGPAAVCWLKDGVPAAQLMPCCVSGVKR